MGNLSVEALREARSRAGRISGNRNYRKGIGIFALKGEEMKIARSEGGKIGGRVSLKGKVGIHKLTKEELSKAGLVGGRVATLKRGQVPWVKRRSHNDRCDLAEIEFAHNLTLIQGTDYQIVASKLNGLYHSGEEVRDYISVKSAVWRFRKGLIKNL